MRFLGVSPLKRRIQSYDFYLRALLAHENLTYTFV